MPLLTPKNSFMTCGGPKAFTTTTILKKRGAKTSSVRQERCILKSSPTICNSVSRMLRETGHLPFTATKELVRTTRSTDLAAEHTFRILCVPSTAGWTTSLSHFGCTRTSGPVLCITYFAPLTALRHTNNTQPIVTHPTININATDMHWLLYRSTSKVFSHKK